MEEAMEQVVRGLVRIDRNVTRQGNQLGSLARDLNIMVAFVRSNYADYDAFVRTYEPELAAAAPAAVGVGGDNVIPGGGGTDDNALNRTMEVVPTIPVPGRGTNEGASTSRGTSNNQNVSRPAVAVPVALKEEIVNVGSNEESEVLAGEAIVVPLPPSVASVLDNIQNNVVGQEDSYGSDEELRLVENYRRLESIADNRPFTPLDEVIRQRNLTPAAANSADGSGPLRRPNTPTPSSANTTIGSRPGTPPPPSSSVNTPNEPSSSSSSAAVPDSQSHIHMTRLRKKKESQEALLKTHCPKSVKIRLNRLEETPSTSANAKAWMAQARNREEPQPGTSAATALAMSSGAAGGQSSNTTERRGRGRPRKYPREASAEKPRSRSRSSSRRKKQRKPKPE